MTSSQWQASAPTNIALIKYMGKQEAQRNLPGNTSLSYTLNHLYSTVTLTAIDAAHDEWDNASQFNLQEQQRFLRHLQFLKQQFNYTGNFRVYSENNFPAGCGLASSASSFAALTSCALKAFKANLSAEKIAALSRQGSGSSCRSFFSPWALWEGETVTAPVLPYTKLLHQVVVVSREKKQVSSSEAHHCVTSSTLFTGRTARAEQRLHLLLRALQQQDWGQCYQIVWQEFWDMHALFETCAKPFGYFLPESLQVLQMARAHWLAAKDGPLITMDAGPNVHLLYRPDQQAMAEQLKHKLTQQFMVL